MGGEFITAGNRRGETKMLEGQRALFIAKLIKSLGDEDWIRGLIEKIQSIAAYDITSDDVFYDNLYNEIKHEIDKLKQQ
jgi:hypothetical protein